MLLECVSSNGAGPTRPVEEISRNIIGLRLASSRGLLLPCWQMKQKIIGSRMRDAVVGPRSRTGNYLVTFWMEE